MKQIPTWIITVLAFVFITNACTKDKISTTVNSNDSVTIVKNASPGCLATVLSASQLLNTKSLTINGKINEKDFETMRDSMPNLHIIDLSVTQIEACKGLFFAKYLANTIPNYSFTQKHITSLTLPNTITRIDDYAFSISLIDSTIVIPSSVTSIGNYAFDFCRNLTTMTIPSSVKILPTGIFDGCIKLRSVTIPSTLTTIGASAFFDCSALSSITIPSSVKSIDSYAFENCNGLKSVYVGSTIPINLNSANDVFANIPTNSILYVPKGSKAAYQAAAQWSAFSTIVEQ